MKTNLLDAVMALAPSYKGTIQELCDNAQVERDWYNKLRQGRISDPGVKKIQRLYDELTK